MRVDQVRQKLDDCLQGNQLRKMYRQAVLMLRALKLQATVIHDLEEALGRERKRVNGNATKH